MLDNAVKHSVRVVYDEKTLRQGVLAFVWYRVKRGIGLLGILALVLTIVSIVLADHLSWIQYSGIAAIAVMVLMVIAAYFANMHIKLSRFRQMTDPAVTLDLREDGFDVISPAGTSTLPWSSFTGVLKSPDFWLLFGFGAQFIVLPVRGIPEEALAYLEQKASAGKAVDKNVSS